MMGIQPDTDCILGKSVNKQLLPGLLVDSADYHPEKELFPEGNARGK